MSKNKKIISGIVIIAIIAVLVITGWNKKSTAEYNIGAVISLTGYASVDGLNIKRGMDMAKDELASKGVTMNIAYEDDNTNPSQSVSSIQKILSGSQKVDALVGPIWSFLIDASLPVINTNKIVDYSPCASSEVVNGKSDYIYYGTYKNIQSVGVLSKWLKDNKINSIAIVVSDDTWGQSNLTAFNQAATNAGAKVLMTEKIAFGADRDVIPTIVTKIGASGAQAVLWTGYDVAGTLLANRLQSQHLNIPVVAAASVMRGLVERGNVVPTTNNPVYIVAVPMAEDFKDKFITRYGDVPGTCADSAYDGIMILADALKNSQKQGITLNEYLKTKTNYNGYLGNYQFDANGDIKSGNWEIKQLFAPVKK